MAWDSKSSRRRGNSTATLPYHTRQQQQSVKQASLIQPNSPHVADPFLQDFLDPGFDPVAYLNSVLPPLQSAPGSSASLRSTSAAPPSAAAAAGGGAVPLTELSARAQASASALSAHAARLGAVLTQLTDEILRSGSRLAYEVELLRGEAIGLAEALTEGLRDDVAMFVPGGVDAEAGGVQLQPPQQQSRAAAALSAAVEDAQHSSSAAGDAPPVSSSSPPAAAGSGLDPQPAQTETPALHKEAPAQPAYITQLRTLTIVRSRLESVIKTFGQAMEFVFPPSEVSVSSSFLSVSAPEPGGPDSASVEEKGQQVLRRLREEVAALLAALPGEGNDDDDEAVYRGVEAAARRVEELRDLCRVWKGTAEEKGRARFVDGLARMVEDRHRELLREVEAQVRADADAAGRRVGLQAGGGGGGGGGGGLAGSSAPPSEGAGAGEAAESSRGAYAGYGFISQLQKIRGGL